jgi:hypothetical protein
MSTREIEPAMVLWLDKKLAENGLAQLAIKEKKARLLFQLAAEACVGIREKTGHNDGPMVELIQKTIGGAGGEAWCMAFIQTALAYVEVKTGIKSPVYGGEHCLTVWAKTDETQRVLKIPAPGAIIIWKHGKTINGHTGILRQWKTSSMFCVEGNTNAGLTQDGSIEREGGGVYLTKRNTIRNGSMAIVGFLKPF